jgi:hypothetical protein
MLERQRIVRLVVKEVLVADDTIVIRHCIPVPSPPPNGSSPAPDASDNLADNRSYLLRTGRGRSPLVSRPEGRPGASVERGRFCWLNCERGGTPWGAWGGTTSKPDVVPSLSPLTIVFRCVPRRSRRAGVPEQNRRRAIGTEECRDASVANGWSTWCATALLLGLECPEQELYSSSRVDVHNIP